MNKALQGTPLPEEGPRSESFRADTLWCVKTVQNRKQNNRSVIENRYQ